jgi:hypothetical protein
MWSNGFGQGRRLEPTWPVRVPDGTGISHIPVGQMYSRRFLEDIPGNSDELAGTESLRRLKLCYLFLSSDTLPCNRDIINK